MTKLNSNETPKVLGGFGDKKSNGGTQWYAQDRVYDSQHIAMCLLANIPGGSYRYLVHENKNRKRN